MQSNIFLKVVPLLKEKKFNIDCDELIEFLGHYKSKDWLFPSALHRKLKVDIKSIYEILEICVEEGLIEQYLEIYCPYCNRYAKRYYKTIADIPNEIDCPHCDSEIMLPAQHAVVIYRVK